MRSVAIAAVILGATMSLPAQEIRDLRFDVGYGIAPRLSGQGQGMNGFHAIAAGRLSWGEVSLHYETRMSSASSGGYGNEENGTTVSFQVGTTVTGAHGEFTVSAGLGSFRAKTTIRNEYYDYTNFTFVQTVTTQEVSKLAIPADIRMCWNFSDGFGLGAAVLGAYVEDNSYAGYQVFVRIGL